MLAYTLRRLASGIAVLLAVSVLCFLIFRFMGDPVLAVVGYANADQQIVDAARVRLGLDKPLLVQYFVFLGKAVRGDFGISYTRNRPVISVIAERIPATFELVAVSMTISTLLGLALGILAAVNPRSLVSKTAMAGSLVGISIPAFLAALLLMLFFGVVLRWLPVSGRGDTVALGAWTTGLLTVDGLRHLVLPAATLIMSQLAMTLRLVRAEMLDVLSQDYVRTAWAKGIRRSRVVWTHALKNALIPVLTIVGLQFSESIAFSLVTEVVFQWPGLGALLVSVIFTGDAPVVVVYLMFVAILIILVNLVVDLLYAILDPRIRYS